MLFRSPVRYSAWLLCAVAMLLSAFTWVAFGAGGGLVLLFALLTALGFRDMQQTRHSVLRNYPVIGHLRFLLEFIRPEMRQYFIEGDNEAAPFSRSSARWSTSAPRAKPTNARSAPRWT